MAESGERVTVKNPNTGRDDTRRGRYVCAEYGGRE